MDPAQVQKLTGEVSRLMGERLGARGASLGERLANRGGALPRRVRRAADVLAEAEAHSAVPKLFRFIDMQAIGRAHATCVKYLRRQGAGDRRRSFALDAAASIVFGLVVVAVAALAVMRWRGLL